MAIIDDAIAWRDADFDPDTRAELADLITRSESRDSDIARPAIAAIESAFAGTLEFGTAGLRGQLGAGPARMNRIVVMRAAAGFARWLQGEGITEGRVIVGYDARYKSADFALDTAQIFAGAGYDVLLTDEPTPTPLIAFGIQHYGCVAGIVVTASHNPPQDNGYKVYPVSYTHLTLPTNREV